jgi:transposase InsO family protein
MGIAWLLVLAWLWLHAQLGWRRLAGGERDRGGRPTHELSSHKKAKTRNHPKPPWVRSAVIRYKALSPGMSCRIIEQVFNREYADRGMSVGKTYVGDVLRKHHADIARLRRSIKHRTPRSQPVNRTWGLDLTGKTDLSERQKLILGVIDHGSRACLVLKALSDKSSLSLLRELTRVFRRCGIPRRIRVDNEACLNSLPMRAALALLGVRLQRIQLHCPWQNGRVERLFGTLKGLLDGVAIADHADLSRKLAEFRAWYNHVGPHQHLRGCTPAEAWDGRSKAIGRPRWFSVWDGVISGWYFPP